MLISVRGPARLSTLLLVGACSVLGAFAQQLNPTVKLLPKPQTSVPPECEEGLAPAVPRAIIAEAPAEEKKPLAPPTLDLKTRLRAVLAAAEQNDRSAFEAALAEARTSVNSYPPGGERNAANEVLIVFNDLERLWDYEFTSPTGAFFDASTDFVSMMKRYGNYPAAIADQTISVNGQTVFPTDETRRFLASEAARRLDRLGVRMPERIAEAPPAPKPHVVPAPVPQPAHKPPAPKQAHVAPQHHEKTPAAKAHKPPVKIAGAAKPPESRRAEGQKSAARAESEEKSGLKPASPSAQAPKAGSTSSAAAKAAPSSAAPKIAAAPSTQPHPAVAPPESGLKPAATSSGAAKTGSMSNPAPKSVPTSSAPPEAVSTTPPPPPVPLPTDTMTTQAAPQPPTATTATNTATGSQPNQSGGRMNLLFALILILLGIGVLIILFRASD